MQGCIKSVPPTTFWKLSKHALLQTLQTWEKTSPPHQKKKKKENTGYGKEFNLISSLFKATQLIETQSWALNLTAGSVTFKLRCLLQKWPAATCARHCVKSSPSVINPIIFTETLEAGMIITQLLLRKLRPRELKQPLKVHTGK